MPASDDTHPFRDSSAGVQAKRDKLLGDRRAELAIMSHSIRRIYVSRAGRLAGSGALIVGGALLLAMTQSTDLADLAASVLPGEAPAPLTNVLFGIWIASVVGVLLGRSVAERRFTTAMSKAVLPSADAHHDVARLAGESPDDVGRAMAHKQGRLGRALPIIACGLILPATTIAAGLSIDASGYPRIDTLEALLASSAALLLGLASLATFFAAVLYARPRRAWSALAALTCAHVAGLGFPSWPFMLGGALVLSVFAGITRRRQLREEYVLGQDGAPLPKPLQLRKRLVGAARKGAQKARSLASLRPRRVHVLACAALAVAGLSLPMHSALQGASDVSDTARPPAVVSMVTPTAATANSPKTSSVTSLEDSAGLVLDFDFADRRPLVASDVLSGVAVPPGFRASIYVTTIDSSGAFFLSFFDSDQAPRHLPQGEGALTETLDNCSEAPVPLLLMAEPYGQHYTSTTASELMVRYYITFELLTLSEC